MARAILTMCSSRREWPIVLALLWSGCVNTGVPHQTSLWATAPAPRAQLAILEFSERGNLFDREKLKALIEHAANDQDTLAIVFVHGWKHDARESDPNLESFRTMLAALPQRPHRNLLGVYIGWPGRSLEVPVLEELTFWSRKAVAAEVAKGGVTEVLLRLERALVRPDADNSLIVVGHSFGGAIVLGALNEVFLDRLAYADPIPDDANGQPQSAAPSQEGCIRRGPKDLCDGAPCVLSRRFGHGVVLLNPAIEANQILQLKEMVAERCFPRNQAKLLHVISTAADTATHRYFPIGQALSGWQWTDSDLDRVYREKHMKLSESALSTAAVGNFGPFWTGRMQRQNGIYNYCSFALNNAKACPDESAQEPVNLIPTRTYEPLSFVYTDETFMKDHNDVFNPRVTAYLRAIAMEAAERRLPPERRCEQPWRFHCAVRDASSCLGFGRCFERLQEEPPAEIPAEAP